jgi:hypothetical protein
MKSALLLALCCFLMSSCTHDLPVIGGKGGNAVLKVTPKHHTNKIDSCTIHIKYNAIDAPAGGFYDDSAKCIKVGGVPVATFIGLKRGNYYLYGNGWDPTLSPPKAVKGGFAYFIQDETTQSLDLAVTEGD